MLKLISNLIWQPSSALVLPPVGLPHYVAHCPLNQQPIEVIKAIAAQLKTNEGTERERRRETEREVERVVTSCHTGG